jgi:hypothetical protein
MDCLYDAFREHLQFLDVQEHSWDKSNFNSFRNLTHPKPGPVVAGIAPYIIKMLAQTHDLKLNVQHRLWTREHYDAWIRKTYDHHGMRYGLVRADLGEYTEEITLRPAIYGLINSKHAIFSTELPESKSILVAIQLIKG